MISLFKKKTPSLLQARVNGKELCVIKSKDLPCEKTPSVKLESNSAIEFVDSQGVSHRHELGSSSGWFHFSIRVRENYACQADCVITDSSKYNPEEYSKGNAIGIRFQPFLISGAKVKNSKFYGKGLFARGLHFSGTITRGNTVLSCECDQCKKSFQIRSFHAGFSNSGYFYSDSGKYTITVNDNVPGCPVPLSEPNAIDLAVLEAALPLAPDGTHFKYLNPFRCPNCLAPYIDFEKNPKDRPREYYGNYFVGNDLLNYEPVNN